MVQSVEPYIYYNMCNSCMTKTNETYREGYKSETIELSKSKFSGWVIPFAYKVPTHLVVKRIHPSKDYHPIIKGEEINEVVITGDSKDNHGTIYEKESELIIRLKDGRQLTFDLKSLIEENE